MRETVPQTWSSSRVVFHLYGPRGQPGCPPRAEAGVPLTGTQREDRSGTGCPAPILAERSRPWVLTGGGDISRWGTRMMVAGVWGRWALVGHQLAGHRRRVERPGLIQTRAPRGAGACTPDTSLPPRIPTPLRHLSAQPSARLHWATQHLYPRLRCPGSDPYTTPQGTFGSGNLPEGSEPLPTPIFGPRSPSRAQSPEHGWEGVGEGQGRLGRARGTHPGPGSKGWFPALALGCPTPPPHLKGKRVGDREV